MIPGSKGYAFHACMKQHDFGIRKTRESSPNRAKYLLPQHHIIDL